jgi:uncharacterized protein YdhG (YjbR/CyaY superfamily)
MQSQALTTEQYLNELPDDRKLAITAIRDEIAKNIPKGFVECMNYGMIGFVVPHELYPAGYHCAPSLPLPFLNIASQKQHITIYHMGLYAGAFLDWFTAEFEKRAPKKLNMGKSCIRFKKLEEIPLDLIGELVSKITPAQWIAMYESNFKNK